MADESELSTLRAMLREKADLLELANARIRDLENELEAERAGKAMLENRLRALDEGGMR